MGDTRYSLTVAEKIPKMAAYNQEIFNVSGRVKEIISINTGSQTDSVINKQSDRSSICLLCQNPAVNRNLSEKGSKGCGNNNSTNKGFNLMN